MKEKAKRDNLKTRVAFSLYDLDIKRPEKLICSCFIFKSSLLNDNDNTFHMADASYKSVVSFKVDFLVEKLRPFSFSTTDFRVG